MKREICLFIVLLVLAGCKQKEDYNLIISNPDLYAKTVFELNSVVMGNGFSPVVASRNYTYANIAAYECIAAGNSDKYHSLSGQLTGYDSLNMPVLSQDININYAAFVAFCKVGESVTFPQGSMKIFTDSIGSLMSDHGMPAKIKEASIQFGFKVADNILKWARKDNYAEMRSAKKYEVTNKPGTWIPTPPLYASAIEQNWNKIRCMVMDSAAQFITPRPIPYNITDKTGDYYRQVITIKEAGDSLNDEQKNIADFWDDNPMKLNVTGHVQFITKKFSPPGHWMSITGIAAKKAGVDYAETVYAYTITSIALFDAFIQCWDEKYRSIMVRPETVINQYIDPNWRPYLQTPPFPEYTCGHSTISASAAEALTKVFGDNFSFTDSTELLFGIKSRRFSSFRQAADENNWARFYGGIHFHSSCIISTTYGRKVGQLVVTKLKMKKN